MKIAIYHNLPSGGGKRALFEMARRLATEHTLDVYTLSSANHEFCDIRPYSRQHHVFNYRPLPLARSPFGRINQGIRSADLLRLRNLQKNIAHKIDAAGYDAVFVHNCQYGQSPALLQYLQTPSVYYCAEPPRQLYEPPLWRPYTQRSRLRAAIDRADPFPATYRYTLARLDRVNTRSASVVLTNSSYSYEVLYRIYGVFAKVCYLGVDTQLFRCLSVPKADYVLSVGAMRPDKGFDFLLRSLACVDIAYRPRLIIVSNFAEPRECAYLDQLARESGVTVEFRSLIADEELTRLYNQALLTLYAPVMEPFGFVALESMACGTPVVGVREAGVRESVADGFTGVLTERDPRQFADAVEGLLRDSERRTAYGRNSRAYVEERWHWERCVDYLSEHLVNAARQKSVRIGGA
ncbi:MAG: glycosyltransferase family 4 protein [Chloroflexi bacterium]|nr:glycosyltransferase family 4 protein [Chloroflexota bacterium]